MLPLQTKENKRATSFFAIAHQHCASKKLDSFNETAWQLKVKREFFAT